MDGSAPDGGTQTRLTARDELWLLGDVIDDPKATLQMRADRFRLRTGVTVHISTVCRAMRRLNQSFKSLQHWAKQRDEQRCEAFVVELMTFCCADEIVAIDELSRDVGKSKLVWLECRGCPPVERNVIHSRAGRVSGWWR